MKTTSQLVFDSSLKQKHSCCLLVVELSQASGTRIRKTEHG